MPVKISNHKIPKKIIPRRSEYTWITNQYVFPIHSLIPTHINFYKLYVLKCFHLKALQSKNFLTIYVDVWSVAYLSWHQQNIAPIVFPYGRNTFKGTSVKECDPFLTSFYREYDLAEASRLSNNRKRGEFLMNGSGGQHGVEWG